MLELMSTSGNRRIYGNGSDLEVHIGTSEHGHGSGSLMDRWVKAGNLPAFVARALDVDVYYTREDGSVVGMFNPTEKPGGDGYVIDFDWVLEATDENERRILDEVERRYEEHAASLGQPEPEPPYLRAFEEALDEAGWAIHGDLAKDGYLELERRTDRTGYDFIGVFDMRGRDASDPQAWGGAAREVAEGFDPEEMSVRWFGANRGEPSLMDMLTDLTEFKQGALAELPDLAEAATWRDFSDADVEVQKAAWAMDLGGGRQAVAECHLTEDDESPWGCGFYFAGFTFDPDEGEWVEQDGGLFWGYRSADDPELTIEVLGSCGVSFEDGDFARVDYGVLHDCGVFGGEGRPLTHEELSPAAPDDGPGGCDLDLEAGDAREARDAVNGPTDRADRDLGAR